MNLWKCSKAQAAPFVALLAFLLVLTSCGGGSSSSNNNPPPTPVNNVQAVVVNGGPANNAVNDLLTDVTICVPGSSNCQTIPDVLVDSGSEGLRLLSPQVTLSLPAITETTTSGALHECVTFVDGSYVWGPVVSADVQMADEKASSVPIQLINPANTGFAVPSDCTSGGGLADNTVSLLGANGILGIGVFQQDCGPACAGTSVPPVYYVCANAICNLASVPLNFQLQNPVFLFPQDNNGVLVTLPAVDPNGTGMTAVSGSLIFGIGTQSNNALGSAQIYTTDPNTGNFQTTYNNVAYSQSFIDSGSNGLYFLDSATTGIPECSDAPGFYCPPQASPVQVAVTNTGHNGTTGPLTFTIFNADALFTANNSTNTVFSNLGGTNGAFDFGLPFFYGRNVFVGIEGQTGPNNVVGPYWAY
ncbi:MAG: DUF3443 domain-containing protein [Acidobacteriia bacterium]|nr:DUF3443 domain-containing protein [Terriglobia bacterium]